MNVTKQQYTHRNIQETNGYWREEERRVEMQRHQQIGPATTSKRNKGHIYIYIFNFSSEISM